MAFRGWLILAFLATVLRADARQYFLPHGASIRAMRADSAGNLCVLGSIPPDKPKSSTDSSDVFVARLSRDGSRMPWTLLSGTSGDYPAPRRGPDDSIYVAGYTQSADFPTTSGALQTTKITAYFAQGFAAKVTDRCCNLGNNAPRVPSKGHRCQCGRRGAVTGWARTASRRRREHTKAPSVRPTVSS
jgi:hypothetical protein